MREKTAFDRIEAIKDGSPFTELRKAILRIKAGATAACRLVISAPVFEGFILIVILMNTAVLAL